MHTTTHSITSCHTSLLWLRLRGRSQAHKTSDGQGTPSRLRGPRLPECRPDESPTAVNSSSGAVSAGRKAASLRDSAGSSLLASLTKHTPASASACAHEPHATVAWYTGQLLPYLLTGTGQCITLLRHRLCLCHLRLTQTPHTPFCHMRRTPTEHCQVQRHTTQHTSCCCELPPGGAQHAPPAEMEVQRRHPTTPQG